MDLSSGTAGRRSPRARVRGITFSSRHAVLVKSGGVLPIRTRRDSQVWKKPSAIRNRCGPLVIDSNRTRSGRIRSAAASGHLIPISSNSRRSRGADSWAEWLYFNGRAGGNRFYLTFMVGPATSPGKRTAGVRLQLDREGTRESYSQSHDVSEADVLRSAPDITIGSSQVRLDGLRYRITLHLPAEDGRSTIEGDLLSTQ